MRKGKNNTFITVGDSKKPKVNQAPGDIGIPKKDAVPNSKETIGLALSNYLKARKALGISDKIPYQIDIDINEDYVNNPYIIYHSNVAADYVKFYFKNDIIKPEDYCIYVISEDKYNKRLEELGKSYKPQEGSRAHFMGLTWDDYDETEKHMFVLRSFNLELSKRRKAGEPIDMFAHCLHIDTWKKKEQLIKEEHELILRILEKRGFNIRNKDNYSLMELMILKSDIDMDLKGLMLGWLKTNSALNLSEELLFEFQVIAMGLGTYDEEKVKSRLLFMIEHPTYNFESLKADVYLYSDSLFNFGKGRDI